MPLGRLEGLVSPHISTSGAREAVQDLSADLLPPSENTPLLGLLSCAAHGL